MGGIDFVFPSKLCIEKRNPKRIISSKLDYFLGFFTCDHGGI